MKRSQSKAVFSVRSAESPNGGAWIPGAAAEGKRLAELARARGRLHAPKVMSVHGQGWLCEHCRRPVRAVLLGLVHYDDDRSPPCSHFMLRQPLVMDIFTPTTAYFGGSVRSEPTELDRTTSNLARSER